MIKDVADLFAAEGEGAKETIEGLKDRAKDALDVAVAEAPKGSARERYRYAREHIFPLLLRLEDAGERSAALNDVAEAMGLGKRDLRKVFSNLEEEAREEPEEERGEQDLAPEPGTERHERAVELLRSPDLLLEAARAMERLGHVGEDHNKQLAFVCAVSARAASPIQPSTHAQSSAGKNYLWDAVLSLLPEEGVVKRSGLSAKALFRTEVDLRGAVLYLQEVAGSEGAEFAIRVMQSDGRLVYEATEKTPDGDMRNVVHEKEGPVVIVQTTTMLHIHHENETRVLPIYIDESEEQTERIVRSALRRAKGEGDDNPEERERLLGIWHDAIRLLEPGKVIVPFADRIEMPTSAVRVRRDVGKILDLVRIVAWLRQHHRERDERGRIVAAEDDFGKALELVAGSLMRAWKALAPLEEVVLKAIKRLPEARQQNGFKRSDLRLGDTSGRRIQEALKSLTSTGYLDSDGRRGPQGSTYTLAREPEEAALGISLRPPDEDADDGEEAAGEADEWDEEEDEEEKRGSRGITRDNNRAIESPDLQGKDANARSRGGEGEEDFGEQGTRESEEAEGEADTDYLEKLTERGWFRSRDLVTRAEKPTVDSAAVDEDPVARWIRSQLYLYYSDPCGGQPWAGTAQELCEVGAEDEPLPAGWPSSPREMHEHLVRMAPALQTKDIFKDPHVEDYYDWHLKPGQQPDIRREGYLHVEHWRKEGTAVEEGVWVFLPLKPRWQVPEDEIEMFVWRKVEELEGLREDTGFNWGD
ncbi:MAG TPA: hypothetical protein VNA27_01825 [Rubrobacteraceae bacterium]|nr:hypothetical protein [Rubrobacteraceae bacterium]